MKPHPNYHIEEPPPGYVMRKDIQDILDLINSLEDGPYPILHLHGTSGMGKSTIAAIVCDKLRGTSHVRDGMLYITVGEKTEEQLTELLSSKARLFLNVDSIVSYNLETAKQMFINEVIGTRQLLLVIDDVRKESHFKTFISTHNPNVIRIFISHTSNFPNYENVKKFAISKMDSESSIQLLSRELSFTEECHDLLAQLAEKALYYPMALQLINGGMRQEQFDQSIREVIIKVDQYLTDQGLSAYDSLGSERTVAICVANNLKYLNEVQRQIYERLVIFSNPESINRDMVERFITIYSNGNIKNPSNLINLFAELSLISKPSNKLISINDVIFKYLSDNLKDQHEYHTEFLELFDIKNWQKWKKTDKYLWENAIYHYVEGKKITEAFELATDINFITHKIAYTESHFIVSDLLMLIPLCSESQQALIQILLKRLSNCNHLLISCEDNQLQIISALTSRVFFDIKTAALPSHFEDYQPLPDLPSNELLRTFWGHSGRVYGCHIEKNGKFIVTASDDKTIKLWSVENGNVLRTFEGHDNRVFCVKINPTNHFILSGSADCILKTWEIKTGLLINNFIGHQGSIWSCCISEDNECVVSASEDKTVRVWAQSTGECLQILSGHKGPVTGCCISKSKEYIVSAGHDNNLIVWKKIKEKYEQINVLKGHTAAIWSCAVSDTGRIISSSIDCQVFIWDLFGKTEQYNIGGHDGPIWGCDISEDGKLGFSVSEDLEIKVWDLINKKRLCTLIGHSRYIWGVSYCSKHKLLLTCSLDATAKLWDLTNVLT